MSEKTEKEKESFNGKISDLQKKLEELVVRINETSRMTGKPNKPFEWKTVEDLSGKKYTINEKNIAATKIEEKLNDICKDMEQTDKKVAKLKKKLMSEI